MKLSTALSVFTLSIFLATGAFGQGTPDCQWTDTFTSATAGVSHAATSEGSSPCVAYRVTYDAIGMTAVSLQIEGAPWNSGGTAAGTFAALTGSAIVQGSNPLTDPNNATLNTTGHGLLPVYSDQRNDLHPHRGIGQNHGKNVRIQRDLRGKHQWNWSHHQPHDDLGRHDLREARRPPRPAYQATSLAGIECLQQLGTGSVSAAPYWDTCPNSTVLTYYYTPTASAPTSSYLQMTPTHPSSMTALTFSSVASNAVLQNWATNAGVPSLTTIPPGAFDCHVRGYKVGGSTTTLYCELWEVSSAEVDIGLIGTTEQSAPLTTFETGYDLHYIQNTTYTLASINSRIVARVWENSVASPTIVLTVGGESDAHLQIPSNSIDVTNFVPYTGATADVNLGGHDLTNIGHLAVMDPDSAGAIKVTTVNDAPYSLQINNLTFGNTVPTSFSFYQSNAGAAHFDNNNHPVFVADANANVTLGMSGVSTAAIIYGPGSALTVMCWKADAHSLGYATVAEITAGTCH